MNPTEEEKDELEKLYKVGEEINHYLDHQLGDQPVRVLNNLMLFQLLHENGYINYLFRIGVLKHGVFPEISIIHGNECLRKDDGTFKTPFIDVEKHLQIHETFLSMIWILSYTLLALLSERYYHPDLPKDWLKDTEERQQLATDLYDYAKLLVVDFISWNKEELPNPEKYVVEQADYIGQAKMYYTEAVKFILYHEFVHAILHIDNVDEKRKRLDLELEADRISLDLVLNMDGGKAADFMSECGAVIGVLTNFIVSNKTKKVNYPNLEDRLKNVLDRCKSNYKHFAFCMACIGIELWADQFSIELEQVEVDKDFEKKFSNYYNQLSKME